MSLHDYQSERIESQWYTYWQTHKFFSSSPQKGKTPYTVLLPPPNITGVLHMGHVLNATKQDILVRRARMQGKEVCWVPGLDHASIATEAKVVASLKKEGIHKRNMKREDFLKRAWAWKKEYGTIIIKQLHRLGVSCDWDRLRFTMEPALAESVTKAFVTLYERGYIYRGYRMIHWDPAGKTALSDDEVIHRKVNGHFYHINYPLLDIPNTTIEVATTRPETLLGDTALCVHPDDERYQHLIGKRALVPLINREIPIISDPYVEKTMGTGCLKVTPAHDANDYKLGLKHKLPIIEIFHPDGTLNQTAQRYIGEDRFVARKKIITALEKEGYIAKIVPHVHQVGFSERTNTVVEPRLSTQWFVKMKKLAEPALKSVADGTIKFHPAKFQNTYNAWLNNVKDWCISRQLWWGHRIPAYYLADGRHVIAATREEAVKKAQLLSGNNTLSTNDLKQDEDVLDTWFSSSLLPMSVFDGMIKPDNPDFAYYYPTNDLVTGPDIIFFWVARMIMASYAFTNKPPFKNVYFNGIVRDKKGRKMSKSLGNSPDTLGLIQKYGADGVRAGVLFSTPAGNDLLFDEKLCEQGKKFIHKIWNALKLVKGWQPSADQKVGDQKIAIEWFEARYQETVRALETSLAQFRISEAFIILYKLIWSDFCAHYLEMVKPAWEAEKKIPLSLYETTVNFFERLIKLLHPFMPFITEEVWHQLKARQPKDSITLAPWPTKVKQAPKKSLDQAKYAFELISHIRHLRRIHKVSAREILSLVRATEPTNWLDRFAFYITKKANVKIVTHDKPTQKGISFIIGQCQLSLPVLNVKKENGSQEGLEKEYAYQKAFLAIIEKKLANKKFIANAPNAVIVLEEKKKKDTIARIKVLAALLKKG